MVNGVPWLIAPAATLEAVLPRPPAVEKPKTAAAAADVPRVSRRPSVESLHFDEDEEREKEERFRAMMDESHALIRAAKL